MSESAPPSPTARRYPQAQESKTPLVIILFLILVVMVPIEFSLQLGPLFLPASRFCLIALFFMILPRLGELKLQLFDWLFIAHVGWVCVAYVLIYPISTAIEMSGAYVLEFLVTYLTARIYLEQISQIRSVIQLLFVLVLISGILALPEALTGVRFIHDFASSLTGKTYKFSPDMRMGITRAASFFEHPILYGVFCASALGLVWFVSTPAQRMFMVPIIAIATWLSASSAPLLIVLIQLVLIAIESFTRTIRRRDKLLGLATATFAALMQIFTGRGVIGLVMLITINPGTAYTRRAQWNFAIDDVLRNPWFGFVPSTYTRPFWLAPSIDNWWLLIMMRSGIPSLILLALSVLFMWIAIARRDSASQLFKNLRTGWGLMMIALILGAATVTFFGKLQPLFAFYLGMGAALATCALPKEDGEPTLATGPRRGNPYTRFPRGVPGDKALPLRRPPSDAG